MKLLMCDDDISTLDVVQNQVDWAELGITRILRAYNGNAAKELLLKEKPELVLCDIGMPLCDGMEVLRFVHENGLNTRFAFMTCYESFEYAREAIRYGAVRYLTKPLDMDELKSTLKQMAQDVRRAAMEKPPTKTPSTNALQCAKLFCGLCGTELTGHPPPRWTQPCAGNMSIWICPCPIGRVCSSPI